MSKPLTLSLTLTQLFHPNPESIYFIAVDELRSVVRPSVRVTARVGVRVRFRARAGIGLELELKFRVTRIWISFS